MRRTGARFCWRRTPCLASRRACPSSARAWIRALAPAGTPLPGSLAPQSRGGTWARPPGWLRAHIQPPQLRSDASVTHIACVSDSETRALVRRRGSRAPPRSCRPPRAAPCTMGTAGSSPPSKSLELLRARWPADAGTGKAATHGAAAATQSSLSQTLPSPAASMGLPGTPDVLTQSLSHDALLGARLQYGCVGCCSGCCPCMRRPAAACALVRVALCWVGQAQAACCLARESATQLQRSTCGAGSLIQAFADLACLAQGGQRRGGQAQADARPQAPPVGAARPGAPSVRRGRCHWCAHLQTCTLYSESC